MCWAKHAEPLYCFRVPFPLTISAFATLPADGRAGSDFPARTRACRCRMQHGIIMLGPRAKGRRRIVRRRHAHSSSTPGRALARASFVLSLTALPGSESCAHQKRGPVMSWAEVRTCRGQAMWAKVVALCPSANVPRTITGRLEWRAAVDKRTNKRARPILAQRIAAQAELHSATTPLIGALSGVICILRSIVQSSSWRANCPKAQPLRTDLDERAVGSERLDERTNARIGEMVISQMKL